MKLASHFIGIEDILKLAVRVEELGFDSIWTTEGRMSPDSVTTTSAIAALTHRIRIGTSVVNPFSRSPALIAVSAASIDRISKGRFILGIGAGDPPTLEKQDISYHLPLTRLRECVTVLRDLLAGKCVSYAGEAIRVADLEMDFRPYQDRIPFYVAGTGSRALRQAHQIGDGILLNVCVSRPKVAEVVAMAGQDQNVKVIGNIVVGMHSDRDVAIRGAKPLIVNYLTRFPAIAKASGLPETLLQKVREAKVRDLDEACAVLPDRCVTDLAAVGNPEDCRRWIRAYANGMDEALLTPAFGDPTMIVDELAGLLS